MNPHAVLLVMNAGSSSIKFACFRQASFDAAPLPCLQGELVDGGQQRRLTLATADRRWEEAVSARARSGGVEEALGQILDTVCRLVREGAITPEAGTIAAVGHRIVHGGEAFAGPVVITAAVRQSLEQLMPLAPLHMPHNLGAIDVVSARLPEATQVACFDTAFHQTCPPAARRFAIPRHYHDAGLKRYGFHGLSYEYVARRFAALTERLPRRVVVAHLGAGASLCGLLDGKSVTTTMGYTPLDGLVMATRCGSLDPGVVLALATRFGHSVPEIEAVLSTQSGLLGVSGVSGDMATLLAANDPQAEEAIELFCRAIVRETAAAAAELGGLDALVFTGGIGSHSPAIRQRVCQGLTWLGVSLSPQANREAALESRLDTGSGPALWTIKTDEQLVIAEHVLQVLKRLGQPSSG